MKVTSFTPTEAYLTVRPVVDSQLLRIYEVVNSPTGDPAEGAKVMLDELVERRGMDIGDQHLILVRRSAMIGVVEYSEK